MEFCKVMEERMRMCDTLYCEDCPLNEEAKKLSETRIEHYDCDGVTNIARKEPKKLLNNGVEKIQNRHRLFILQLEK